MLLIFVSVLKPGKLLLVNYLTFILLPHFPDNLLIHSVCKEDCSLHFPILAEWVFTPRPREYSTNSWFSVCELEMAVVDIG